MFSYLSFIPDLLVYGVFAASAIGLIVGTVFSKIPVVGSYASIVKIIAIPLLVISLWLLGYKHNDLIWQARVSELQEQIAAAEKESKQKNVEIQTKVVNKIQVVKERGETLIQYVDKEIIKYDDQCKIPQEFIVTINQASERVK